MDSYLELVKDKSKDAVFEIVSDAYPLITSGDLSPEDLESFEDVLEIVIRTWLKNNIVSGYANVIDIKV
jgi:hypothetical protein